MAAATLEQHLESVERESEPRGVAFFDLDGTVIAGYSIIALALETLREGLRQRRFRESLRLLADIVGQKTARTDKGSHYHRLVRRLGRSLAGIREEELLELGERACERHLLGQLFPEAIGLVEAHRAAGHHLVIVTAASHYQVAPLARLLGIDEICCTRLEVIDGHFTGRVLNPLCYGEGKALAARRVLRRRRGALRRSWFYTDSLADLPLLRRVGHPVAINPREDLAREAARNDWPILRFSSRGTPDLESLLRTALTGQALAATALVGSLASRLGGNRLANASRVAQLLGDVGSGLAGLEFEVEGAEHLHAVRPAVYIFNHQSLLDGMVIAHLLRRDTVALCKAEMARVPVLGNLLRQTDTIFVQREEQDQREVLQRAMAVLREGRSLVVAPEGTRSSLGDIRPFRPGALLLARKAGVPLVPIVLHNVKDALPKGSLLIRPTTIRITVLPPLDAAAGGNVRQLARELELRYRDLLATSPRAGLPNGLRQPALSDQRHSAA